MRRATASLAFSALLFISTSANAGLLGYWSFDNPADVGADNSGNGRSATLSGDAAYTASGAVNGGLALDGSGDWAIVPGGANRVDIDNKSFTVSFWAKRGQTNDMDFMIGHGTSGGNDHQLHMGFRSGSQNPYQFGFYGDDLLVNNLPAAADTTNFHHWANTYDATTNTQTIYLDGNPLRARIAHNDFTHQGSDDFMIGRIWDGREFKGVMDEVAVWDHVLGAGDVAQLAAKTATPNDFTAPPPPPTYTGWVGKDVYSPGNTFLPGTHTYDSGTGTVTVTGDGGDIWGNSDQFHFVMPEDPANPGQPLKTSGDFIARARVVDMTEGVNGWQKSGIMARADLDPNSVHTMTAATESNGIVQQWRDAKGGGSGWPGTRLPGSPNNADGVANWLLMTRSGDTFTSTWAPDAGGAPGAWGTPQTHTSPNMPDDVYLGLSVTSHTTGNLATTVFDNVEFVPAMTLSVMGQSSGGSTWHFTSDPNLVDDPSGLAAPVSLGGGLNTASAAVPTDVVDDPFYVVVEATDQGGPPSFAGALMAPPGYVFDSNDNGSQDPGETQFFSTHGQPFGAGEPQWAGSGSLVPPNFFTGPANEVGPAGFPFPSDAEAVWYGPIGGTVYFSAQVPKVIQGTWAPPPAIPLEGTPETSVDTSQSGLAAHVLRSTGQIRDLDTGVNLLRYSAGPNLPGHYANSLSHVDTLDLGESAGAYPGYEAMLAPDHTTNPADPEDTVARFTGYIYAPTDGYTRTFAVSSDDGYRLKIGDTTVLEYLDGRGMPATPDVAAVTFPQAGYWPIEVQWYNGTDGSGLEVSSAEGALWPVQWNTTDFKILGTDPAFPVYPNVDAIVNPPATAQPGQLMAFYNDEHANNVGGENAFLTRDGMLAAVGRADGSIIVKPLTDAIDFPAGGGANSTGGNPFDAIGVNVGNDNIIALWRGQFNAATDGTYQFWTRSDDGTMVFIDGQLVVNNNGWHGMRWRNGSIDLTAGTHQIDVPFFEGGGGAGVYLDWQPPGGSRELMPPSVWQTVFLPPTFGANTPGSPAIPGAVPGGETSGDGALVQAALGAQLPGGNWVDNTSEAIQYFQLYPDGGTTEARPRINVWDSGGRGAFAPGNGNPDDEYPGATPGQNYNNIAFRARALFYSPGNETRAFAVASDDSYRIDINGQTFGWYNGGRGISANNSNIVYVTFPEAGFYKFELYHHEGGGGAALELSQKATGDLLVGGPNPRLEGFTLDLANRFYTFTTHARMSRHSTDLLGAAFAYIPALGMSIPPDHWTVEQLRHFEDTPGLLGAYYVRSGDWAPGAFLGYRHDLVDPAHSLFGGPSPAQTAFNFPNNYGYGPWGNQEDNLHAIWTGTLTVPQDGDYLFAEHVDDRCELWIDGTLYMHDGSWNNYSTATIPLTAGEHDFLFFANEGGGGEFAQLLWLPPWDTTHDPGNPSSWDFVPASYFSFDADLWFTLLEGTGQIGDMLNDVLMQRFPWDPDTEYTLRLTVDFFGQTAIAELTTVFVPEPATCLVLGGGLLVLVRRRRRRK